jgi:hypothetical protein
MAEKGRGMGRRGSVNTLGDERNDRRILGYDRNGRGRIVGDRSCIYALAVFYTGIKGINEEYIPLLVATADVWWELMMKSRG